MRALDRDGTKLAYQESGAGDPPFVFVHGWTCDHTSFAPQVEHFEPTHRVLAVDLRGHGRSDAPEQEYTIPGFADDVAWLCREVGVDAAIFVGHSMGGTVVLELAARHPELVTAVVMIDAAPIVATPEMATASADVVAAFAGPAPDVARAAIAEHAVAEIRDAALRARMLQVMTSVPHHVAASCVGHMGEWDGEAAARASAVPALHIGADSPINDATALRRLNPLIRTGQTVGAGHFNQLDASDQVHAMIDRFLEVALVQPPTT
jgi:pimeloyl-ACP methyl ester carboxylesterase